MTNLKTLHANLEALEDQLIEAQQNLESAESSRDCIEIDVDSFEEEYSSILDDLYTNKVTPHGAHTIKKLQPDTFRQGLVEYCNSLLVNETRPWIDANEKVETIESEIEDLESQVEDLKEDIADLED